MVFPWKMKNLNKIKLGLALSKEWFFDLCVYFTELKILKEVKGFRCLKNN